MSDIRNEYIDFRMDVGLREQSVYRGGNYAKEQ
jgi:hypothetical protein